MSSRTSFPAAATLAGLLAGAAGCGTSSPEAPTCYVGSPAEGGGCVVTLATDQYSPVGLAADATGVYWANSGDGTIVMTTTPEIGGPIVLASGQNTLLAIALDDASVYWTTSNGQLLSVPKGPSAAAPAVLATGPAAGGLGGTGPVGAYIGLAANGQEVFWGELAGTLGQPQSLVMEVSRAGGPAVTVASGPGVLLGLAADVDRVYWSMLVPTDPDLTQAVGEIFSAPVSGGGPTLLATADASLGPIVVDGRNVYFVAAGAIQSVPIGGGAAVQLASVSGPTALATDGANVYWTATGGSLFAVPTGGGSTTTLAGSVPSAFLAAVGPSGVFLLSTPLLGPASVAEVTFPR